jgi:hypothetical protein
MLSYTLARLVLRRREAAHETEQIAEPAEFNEARDCARTACWLALLRAR